MEDYLIDSNVADLSRNYLMITLHSTTKGDTSTDRLQGKVSFMSIRGELF